MKIPKISVVIPTRNRSQSLVHSLGSLLAQSLTPDEIIVVDNGSSDQTQLVVEAVIKNSGIKITYVQENRRGYPFVYNQGLKSAVNDWVAFLDDDCIATHDWYQNIVKAIRSYPQAVVFLGRSEPTQLNHPLGLTENFIKNLGLRKIDGEKRVLDFEILDSKNTVYSKKFLSLNNIIFDESLMLFGGGSSEDCDLGMQIQKASGEAIYEPKIKIYHKEVIDFVSYYKKLVSRTKDHLVYEGKWQTYRDELGFKSVGLGEVVGSLSEFIKKKELSFTQISLVILNVGLSFLLVKIASMFYEKN